MNLNCRYCKKWWQRNFKQIESGLSDGQLSLHIKFWTQDKSTLRIGNVAHQYIDFNHPPAAFEFVKTLIHDQNYFKRYQPDQVPTLLADQYHVEKYRSAVETEQTTKELQNAGVMGLHTIVLDGQWHDCNYLLPAF